MKGLAELHTAHRVEVDEPWMLHGLLGERTCINRAFEGFVSGAICDQ